MKMTTKTQTSVTETHTAQVIDQKNTSTVETVEPDIFTSMGKIVMESKNSRLSPEFLEAVEDDAAPIRDMLHLTTIQAVLYSLFVDHSQRRCVVLTDIHDWIGGALVDLLRYKKDIDVLARRHLINIFEAQNSNPGTLYYMVPTRSINQLVNHEKIEYEDDSNLTIERLFVFLEDFYKEASHGLDYDTLFSNINTLMERNQHLEYARKMLELKPKMSEASFLLFNYVACRAVNENDFLIGYSEIMSFETEMLSTTTVRCMTSGVEQLGKLNLLEMNDKCDFRCEMKLLLSANAIETLLQEVHLDCKELIQRTKDTSDDDDDDELNEQQNEQDNKPTESKIRGMLEAGKIHPKSMFYPSAVQNQVTQLTNLLQEESFQNIRQRMQERNMRQGFACLFYGAPGTGKTETALQLARETGRDIMQVDISEMRNKWVGESEKMVKGLFDRYRKAVETTKLTPILFFNEADALFSKRCTDIERSVDKMENALQNIFLQELENLNGILIATTNLTSNLDKAFERRFLYKVCFERPDSDCRRSIWKSLLPELSDDDAKTLANQYDLSGGQIENISRKCIVDSILYGNDQKDGLKRIMTYCGNETIKDVRHQKVGF